MKTAVAMIAETTTAVAIIAGLSRAASWEWGTTSE
jgi:hypothetical protein